MNHLLQQAAQGDKMEYILFYDLYLEFLKMMKHLGKYVSIGMEQLYYNAQDIKGNTECFCYELGMISEHDDEFLYLMKFIEMEINMGIYNLDTENNKEETEKLLQNYKISYEMYLRLNHGRYFSTTRTVNIGCWFFDFTRTMMRGFVENRDWSMAKVV